MDTSGEGQGESAVTAGARVRWISGELGARRHSVISLKWPNLTQIEQATASVWSPCLACLVYQCSVAWRLAVINYFPVRPVPACTGSHLTGTAANRAARYRLKSKNTTRVGSPFKTFIKHPLRQRPAPPSPLLSSPHLLGSSPAVPLPRAFRRAAPKKEMGRHAKTDSDVTSLAASTPPRSPRGRPAYYVLSPAASHPDVHVGASGGVAGTTPAESPLHYHFHHHHRSSSGVGVGVGAGGGGGGVHHSRESSTGRLLFSDQLRSGGDVAAVVSVPWRRLGNGSGAGSVGDDDDEDDASLTRGGFADSPWRCYALGAFAFFAVFAFFLLVLWGASRSYKPHVVVKVRPILTPSLL